jgi:DNA-binding response OmpR family regulator
LDNLKKDTELRDIPVIMFTTETVRDTVIKLIRMGLRDCIAKPFSREALLLKVNPVLHLFEGEVPSEADLIARAGGSPVAPQAAPPPVIPEEPVKPAVLAIDDKENVLKLIKEYLGDEYDVMPATKGKLAISKIRSTRLDWVFLGMDLPDIRGVEVYKKVKRRLDGRGVKVVGLALCSLVNEVSLARKLGIREFLYKPFTKADLTAVMSKAMSENAGGGPGVEHFLSGQGSYRVLRFPEDNDPTYAAYARALGNKIRKEVTDVAHEGVTRLVIELSSALLTDFSSVKKLIALRRLAVKLKIDVRLVADNDRVKDALREFSETASAVTYDSVDAAVGSSR